MFVAFGAFVILCMVGIRATLVSKQLVRKEIHGLPELSWCSECQDPGTRVQVPGVLDWKLFIRETSKMPSASVRIRAGHADRRVAVKAQVRKELSTPLPFVSSKARLYVQIRTGSLLKLRQIFRNHFLPYIIYPQNDPHLMTA
jgi:hypothetical protein